jgi:hypothetical protein
MSVAIVDVELDSPWLLKCERVHRQLRPHMPANYAEKMARVYRDGGRMCAAVRGEDVVGVGVHRVYENTFEGLQMYVDDLVPNESARSSGVGKALLDHMQSIASARGCVGFGLDSGTQRERAHKFYFREGLVITAFHFTR